MQKIQKAYIKTCEKDVKIYKDIENSQGTLLLQKCRPLKVSSVALYEPKLGAKMGQLEDNLSHLDPDCLIAKVDGLVRLIYLGFLENFGPPIFIYFYTFLHIFHIFWGLKLIG